MHCHHVYTRIVFCNRFCVCSLVYSLSCRGVHSNYHWWEPEERAREGGSTNEGVEISEAIDKALETFSYAVADTHRRSVASLLVLCCPFGCLSTTAIATLEVACLVGVVVVSIFCVKLVWARDNVRVISWWRVVLLSTEQKSFSHIRISISIIVWI